MEKNKASYKHEHKIEKRANQRKLNESEEKNIKRIMDSATKQSIDESNLDRLVCFIDKNGVKLSLYYGY